MRATKPLVGCDAYTKVVTLSIESIASTSSADDADADPPVSCPSCGAPLAGDQRYCLECGERRVPMSSLLFGGAPSTDASQGASHGGVPAVPPSPPGAAPVPGAPQRNQALTVIAGVGVLLLAVGVGVLIGRAGAPKQTAAPAEVITVAGGGSVGATTTGPSEASFTGDWPSGTNGYTVQLQTLPQAGTTVSAVEAAKTAASGKGAKAVGALKSEEFSSLAAGSYVIYSGVHHSRGEAEKALNALRKSFPGATVIHVSNGASGTSGTGSGGSSSGAGGAGSSESHPAPPSVLNNLKGAKGKSYEEKSKNLPDVVETG